MKKSSNGFPDYMRANFYIIKRLYMLGGTVSSPKFFEYVKITQANYSNVIKNISGTFAIQGRPVDRLQDLMKVDISFLSGRKLLIANAVISLSDWQSFLDDLTNYKDEDIDIDNMKTQTEKDKKRKSYQVLRKRINEKIKFEKEKIERYDNSYILTQEEEALRNIIIYFEECREREINVDVKIDDVVSRMTKIDYTLLNRLTDTGFDRFADEIQRLNYMVNTLSAHKYCQNAEKNRKN